MNRTYNLVALILLITVMPVLRSESEVITISGEVKWTDSIDSTYPSREIRVHLYHEDVSGEVFISDTHTDTDGKYTFSYDTDGFGESLDLFLRVYTDSPEYKTFTTGGFEGGDIHEYESDTISDVTTSKLFDVITPNDTITGQAFGVHDALFSATRYATAVRGLPVLTPKSLTMNFPNGEDGSFYTSSKKEIALAAKSVNAWDVIHHEYGHFLSDIDDLDDNPGGEHSLNTSNIPTLGKVPGTKLAWGEGLATYLGIASQFVAKDHLPSILTTGNTDYDSLNATTPEKSFSSELETNTEDSPDGEGDEVAVSRILWDIADKEEDDYAGGQKDLIGIGHDTLYEILNTKIASLDTLDDLWDYFYVHTDELDVGGTPDQVRAILGAVFQEYSVSPVPFRVADYYPADFPAPVFSWMKNNHEANDKFQVLIFNDDFSSILLSHDVVGDVSFYELTEGQWAALKATGFTDFQLVITGVDSAAPASGAYWSGAQGFSILVPTPTTLSFLVVGAIGLIKRRRGH